MDVLQTFKILRDDKNVFYGGKFYNAKEGM